MPLPQALYKKIVSTRKALQEIEAELLGLYEPEQPSTKQLIAFAKFDNQYIAGERPKKPNHLKAKRK